MIVAYHPYGYGGYGLADCAESPNGFALCTEFRSDNTGPPTSVAEVEQSLSAVRAEYPGAAVKTSTFDAFIADVMHSSRFPNKKCAREDCYWIPHQLA